MGGVSYLSARDNVSVFFIPENRAKIIIYFV